MNKIIPALILVSFLFSCSVNNRKYEELQANQIRLEQQIDSLKVKLKDVEELTLTNSKIISDMLQPKPGTLLHEIEKQ